MTDRIKAFVRGMGRAIDLGANRQPGLPNRAASRSDHDALAADWRAVGQDLSRAMHTFSDSNATAPIAPKAR